jgi:hypothetical protein
MSIILDALKKLEQKRRQGSIPDITTIHMPEHLPREEKKKIWPYMIFAALLINAAVLLIWISGIMNRPDQRSDTKTMNAASVTASAEPVLTAQNETPGQTALSDETPEDVKADSPAGVNIPNKPAEKDTESVTAASDQVDAVDEAGKPPADAATEDSGTSGFPVTITPSPEEVERLREEIAAERASIKDTAESLTAPEPEPGSPVTDATGLTDFSRLPANIRKELSGLTISGHIYSNDPSSRLVNIDGLIFHEGEKASNGLLIEEIAMDGVIFRYKGHRFMKKLF